MFPVSMFSMKMYPIDTVNCFPTLVVGYMRQDVADLVEDTDQTVRMTIFVVSTRRVNS